MINSGFIKAIQNEMRKDDGVDGDAQRLSQLVWLIFLKVLDDDEHQKEFLDNAYKPAVPDKYRWKSWAGSDDGLTGEALLDFVNNDLFPSLKALEVDSTNRRTTVIREVFSNSFNYMKNGTQLRKVINKINEIDFNSSDDRHSFGDIYETLLSSLQSAGNAGEFYTPRAITKFIVEMVDPKLGEKVFDPAAGTGGFLTGAIDHVRREVKTAEDEELLQNSIMGVEKKQLPYTLLVTNMIFHGLEEPAGIRHDNTLARPLISYGPEDFVDVITANPPFCGSEEDGIEDNFPSSFRTRETADLFLVLFVRLLKKGGRAGIVLPDGTLFGDGIKARIKQHLLEECNLHTIVRLPGSVFAPYTSIATNLLFFTKGDPTKEVWYYEHRLPEGVKAYNKTKPIRLEEFNPIKEWWNSREESEVSWKVGIDEIIKRGYNLDIKNPNAIIENELNPTEVLKTYRAKKAETTKILEQIKGVLSEALNEHEV
jgi:type I restriction enzyme M protein